MDISQFSPVKNLFNYSTVNGVVNGKIIVLLNYVVGFSALVAVIMIIVAGYMLITAAGDPDKIQQGQKTITAAVVGMVIVFVARILIEFVVNLITSSL